MRTRVGRNRPNTASTPSAKAMSVAVGIGQPSTVGVPAVNARKIAAGTITPPSAAIAGSSALESEFSSPMTSSRFSSTATMKKKIASSPSLIQCPAERSSRSHGMSRWASLTPMNGGSERQVRDDEAEHGRDEEQCGGESLGAEDVHGTPVGKSRCDGRCRAPGTDGWRRRSTSADQTSRHSAANPIGRRASAAPSMAGTARRRWARRRRERPWATSGTMRSARPRLGLRRSNGPRMPRRSTSSSRPSRCCARPAAAPGTPTRPTRASCSTSWRRAGSSSRRSSRATATR